MSDNPKAAQADSEALSPQELEQVSGGASTAGSIGPVKNTPAKPGFTGGGEIDPWDIGVETP